jgi:hypothetical protein
MPPVPPKPSAFPVFEMTGYFASDPIELGLPVSAMVWRGPEEAYSANPGRIGGKRRDGDSMSVLREMDENQRQEPSLGSRNGSRS